MDSMEKIKKLCHVMIGEQEEKKWKAKQDGVSVEQEAKLYSELVGIKMVYNMVLEVEKGGYSVSDEMIEKMESELLRPAQTESSSKKQSRQTESRTRTTRK